MDNKILQNKRVSVTRAVTKEIGLVFLCTIKSSDQNGTWNWFVDGTTSLAQFLGEDHGLNLWFRSENTDPWSGLDVGDENEPVLVIDDKYEVVCNYLKAQNLIGLLKR